MLVVYDDFTILTEEELRATALISCQLLIRMLGWEDATDKGASFAESFTTLGVTFHISRMPMGEFDMRCKLGRLEDIQVLLGDCRRRGEVSVDCFKTDWVRYSRCFTHERVIEAGFSN